MTALCLSPPTLVMEEAGIPTFRLNVTVNPDNAARITTGPGVAPAVTWTDARPSAAVTAEELWRAAAPLTTV